jgi:iron complex transport system substrate-binding protein
MRIVSLLPSATEIVYALGLGDHLVGVSHECDFPADARTRPAVTTSLIPAGGSSGEIDRIVRERTRGRLPLYALDLAALEQLRPDLIITQALCNVCAVSEEDVRAAACSLPVQPGVVNLEARTLADVLDGIRQVAARTGTETIGEELLRGLSARAELVVGRSRQMARAPRIAFLEWLDPPFSGGHWNPELVEMAGAADPLGRSGLPAQAIAWSSVEAVQPEMIFIACCGFDVTRTLDDLAALTAMPGWRDLPAVRDRRVYVADGARYFSRAGPRLLDSLEMLAHAVAPDVHPLGADIFPPVRVDMEALLDRHRVGAQTAS